MYIYFQVDLGRELKVTAVGTRGRGMTTEWVQYVKSYRLAVYNPDTLTTHSYQQDRVSIIMYNVL